MFFGWSKCLKLKSQFLLVASGFNVRLICGVVLVLIHVDRYCQYCSSSFLFLSFLLSLLLSFLLSTPVDHIRTSLSLHSINLSENSEGLNPFMFYHHVPLHNWLHVHPIAMQKSPPSGTIWSVFRATKTAAWAKSIALRPRELVMLGSAPAARSNSLPGLRGPEPGGGVGILRSQDPFGETRFQNQNLYRHRCGIYIIYITF